MIPEFSTLARPGTLAALFLTATPAMAQETAQQVYDAYFVAYSGGQAAETSPEYIAAIALDDQVAKVKKDEPALAGKWSEADTRAAVADGVTRKYSMTISVTDEDALSCEHARPRYAALLGHDAYLKLEPALIFSSDKKD